MLYKFGETSKIKEYLNGPHSAVGNVSGYRCVSDCRSRGCEFDPSVTVYLAPCNMYIFLLVLGGGQDKPTACPPGVKITRVGGKISQAVQGAR